MRHFGNQHVFLFLMAVAAISAFLFPSWTSSHRPRVEVLFAPVAKPAFSAAKWAHDRFTPPKQRDDRDADDIRVENEQLRATAAYLERQLETLRQLNSDRQHLGKVQAYCTAVNVVGGDSGTAQSLGLAPTREPVAVDMFVLHASGIVGKITAAGVGGSRVRLITDTGFSVQGRIKQPIASDDGRSFTFVDRPLRNPPVLAGQGRNTMVIRTLTADDVRNAQIAIGDYVVLNDPTWPQDLQGQPLGYITSISPRRDQPLWVDIRVEPTTQLMHLDYVLVLNKSPTGFASGR